MGQRLLDQLNADVVQIRTRKVQLNKVQVQVLLVRADHSLLGYKYNPGTKVWQYLWDKASFFTGADDPRKEPWLVSQDGFVVARSNTGLHIYKFDDELDLKHLATDGRYHEAYGWSQSDHVLMIGYFFYDSSKIGIISRDGSGKISLEAVMKEEALKRSLSPIWSIENDPGVPKKWSNLKTDISLAYVDSTEQQAFVARDENGFSVFKFDKTHFIRETFAAPIMAYSSQDSDRLYFGKFSPEDRLINNVLHFNESGLTAYRYVPLSRELQPIMYAAQFANKLGWTSEHLDSVVLDDVNGDGIDELLFSGPSGFNVMKFSAEEILDSVILGDKDFDVLQRHVKAFVMPNLTQSERQIVTAYENGIGVSQLELQSEHLSNENGVSKSETSVDSTVNPLPLLPGSLEFVSVLNLHDQLKFTEFIDPRNPLLGTLDFSVPLIEISNPFGIPISQSIKYKEYGAPDVLGAGWSIPVDCIYIDRQGSIFPIDHNYYLVKNGSLSQLHPKLDGTSSDVLSFELRGSPDVVIKYYKHQNMWEIKTKLERYLYGNVQNVDWIQWEPGSEEWPVAHNSSVYVKAKPFAWYLAKREDQHGNHLKYVYAPEYVNLANGNPYVHKLSLLKIISSNGDYARFGYDGSNNSKLLKNYTVRTEAYSQHVQFEYNSVEGKPFLISISQSGIPVLKFKYEGPKHEMTEIVYPNGLVSRFSYRTHKFESKLTANRFESLSDVQLAYGPGYMLIGTKTEDGQVRIKARDVVGSATTQMSSLAFPALGKEQVLSFEMLTAEDFFAIALTHENHQEICMFRQTSDGWSSEASYMRLAKDSTLQTGKSFILVKSGKRLAVLQYIGERWSVKPILNNLNEKDIVKAFSYAYVIYKDTSLTIGFQSDNGTWITRQVPIESNLMESSLLLFNKFETDQKTLDGLKKIFMEGVLNTYHNAIIVRSLGLDGRKIYLRLHCKIFGKSHELAKDETISVLVEDLDNYVLELPPMDENYFKLGYELHEGMFKVTVKDHRGKIMDEVNRIKANIEEEIRKHPHASEKEKIKFRKESHDKLSNDLNEIYKNVTASIPFALDPSKFGVHVNSDSIVAASHKFRFDGSRWNNEKIPQSEINMIDFSLKLGSTFQLIKSGKDETFKLTDSSTDTKTVWNLNTHNGNDIHLNYPAFIGVQNNRSAEIYTFTNRKIHRLPEGEILSRLSNPLAVVTMSEDQKSAIVRSTKSFTNYRQSVIFKQQLKHSDSDIRTTTFEYDTEKVVPFSDGFAFAKSKITPEGKSQLYGWYEDNFNLMDMANSTKTVHNSQGAVVKTNKAEEMGQPKSIDKDGILTDRFGKIEIVDFRPYRISQEVVSYYGFEPYESNRIGANKEWIFDSGMVMKEHSNHFLRMKSGSSVRGQFKPQVYGLVYVFSCWIRTNQKLFNPESISLSVSDRNGQVLKIEKGVTQAQIGQWSYVEVHCKYQGNENIKLDVNVRNPYSTQMDVDHLRLTPLDSNFQANLLDHRSGKVRAVLKNSGLLKQNLLDPNGHVIGKVAENGELEVSITSSKNCALRKNDHLNSRVEMHPMESEITSNSENRDVSKPLRYRPESFSFRFLYKLPGIGRITATLGRTNIVIYRDSTVTKLKVNNFKPESIDSDGEITALLLPTRIAVWIQGHLVEERKLESVAQNWETFELKSTGQGRTSEIFQMYDPSVKVYYLNKLGLITQEIVLKTPDTINIRQIAYDAIDRPILKTKWISLQSDNNSLFNYNTEVITNTGDILNNQKITGLANELNPDCQGYPFTSTSYRNDPLEVKVATGLPGQDFAIQGEFSTKFGTHHNVSTLMVLFPPKMGYRHEFEQSSVRSLIIQVMDKRENKVAELVQVNGHDHRLTTFEYDGHKRLKCTLPPAYHYKAKTLSQTNPFELLTFTPDEILLRNTWGKFYKYDKDGYLIEKTTPDSGKQEYFYSNEGLLRFLIQGDEAINQSTTYYVYGFDGKVAERGIVDLPRSKLREYLSNNTTIPKSDNFVAFDYGGTEVLPANRNLMQMSKKVHNNVTVTEALLFDSKQQIMNQVFVASNNSLSFNYRYQNDKIIAIEYPFFVKGKQLRLSYDYHSDKNIKNVRIGDRIIAALNYTATGSIQEIHFEPQGKFSYKRSLLYNAPGYLTTVTDKFLSEAVDYTRNSYGGQTFGDGTVSSTMFNATWHEYSDLSRIKFKWNNLASNETSNQYAQLCFEHLQKLNYFDDWNRPRKSYYPPGELQLPLVCNTGSRANHISSLLVTKGFPTIYGHRYDYENHKQLIKAKYFQNIEERSLEPLSQNTFSKRIRGISEEKSQSIWNTLKTANFIITDCSNSQVCHAVLGKSLFHPVITKHINAASLETLFINGIKSRKDIPQQIFNVVCEIWHQHDPLGKKQLCASVWREMLANNFVGSRSDRSAKALNPELKDALRNHIRHLGDIAGVLYDHFLYALGNSAGDVQSYDIDPNGNHVHFYTGFKRYRLEYVENTNKISKVFMTNLTAENLTEAEFSMDHDSEGNVIKATHKSISEIVYDSLLKRATEIRMVDGRKLIFHYDVRGERIFKQVQDPNGAVVKEKYYMRDVTGRCLVDYELTYLQSGREPYVQSTAYIYAENQLVGFIRKDQFYSVFTDHEGSVRLVVKNGEVVAAYDYLPYGQLLRKYNSDPDGSIAYLYTGQEWDEETGLFNFHARLYDPEIGRFYQIDPKEQYPSPYVYAGNSPISLVDPDGQFAFIIAAVAFAVVGAYLGASSANNSFNPLKWKLKPTLVGGVLGGIAGALAPAAIGASFTFLTATLGLSAGVAGGIMASTTIGFAYLSGASTNRNWNPIEWNWSSPGTWNSLFSGGLTGLTLFGGIGKVHDKFISLVGFTDKLAFVGVVTTGTIGIGYIAGSSANDWNANFWEWDWKSPATVWKVTMGASFGMSVSPELQKIQTEVVKKIKDFKTLINTIRIGNVERIISEAKIQFQQSGELIDLIRTTLKDLSKQVLRPHGAGLAHVIVVGKRGSSNNAVSSVRSILFEVSKIGIQLDSTGVIQALDDVERLDNREGLRRKRDINCCQLQLHGFLAYKDPKNVLTSSATIEISILNNLFNNIFMYYKMLFEPTPQFDKFDEQTTYLGLKKPPKLARKTFTLNNCHRFVISDDFSHVECYGLNSRYKIFPKPNHQLGTEDYYAKCFPIEYDGQPAVVCHGKSSNLLFTPEQSVDVLDVVNGWLMLALVIPSAMKSIQQTVHGLIHQPKRNSHTGDRASANEIDILKRKLSSIEQKITMVKKTQQGDGNWLTHIWEDLADDVEKLSTKSGKLYLEELTDRLDALEEEIHEVSFTARNSTNNFSLIASSNTPSYKLEESHIQPFTSNPSKFEIFSGLNTGFTMTC